MRARRRHAARRRARRWASGRSGSTSATVPIGAVPAVDAGHEEDAERVVWGPVPLCDRRAGRRGRRRLACARSVSSIGTTMPGRTTVSSRNRNGSVVVMPTQLITRLQAFPAAKESSSEARPRRPQRHPAGPAFQAGGSSRAVEAGRSRRTCQLGIPDRRSGREFRMYGENLSTDLPDRVRAGSPATNVVHIGYRVQHLSDRSAEAVSLPSPRRPAQTRCGGQGPHPIGRTANPAGGAPSRPLPPRGISRLSRRLPAGPGGSGRSRNPPDTHGG